MTNTPTTGKEGETGPKRSGKKILIIIFCVVVVIAAVSYLAKEHNSHVDLVDQIDIQTGNPWGGGAVYQATKDGSLRVLTSGKLGLSKLDDEQFEEIVDGLTGLQKIAKSDWKEITNINDGPFRCDTYTHDHDWFNVKWTYNTKSTERMSFSTGCWQVTYPVQLVSGLVGIYFGTAGNEIRMRRIQQQLDEVSKNADWRQPTIEEYEDLVGYKMEEIEKELFQRRQERDNKSEESFKTP